MVSQAREQQAREAHAAAARAEATAARARTKRDRLISQLRASDPGYYTHARLATIVRCSPELIAHILRNARKVS